MTLSIATDYRSRLPHNPSQADFAMGYNSPRPRLEAISKNGFKYVHWCHHWRSDFMYGASEIAQIERWMAEFDLQLADTHGSEGIEKFWYSPQEYCRLAGVELVKNRIDFTHALGGDAIVMHVYPFPPGFEEFLWLQLRKTLDAVVPYGIQLGVKIAIENLIDFPAMHLEGKPAAELEDNRTELGLIFDHCGADGVGLCWDSGHAALGRDRIDVLETHLDRLIVTHLHDNDGVEDQHNLVFEDHTVDWDKTAALIARSPYNKPLTLEVGMDETYFSDGDFLSKALATGQRLTELVSQKEET